MKNKKGFSFVELIVVITILGALILITYPSIQKVLRNIKSEISDIDKKNISDAAELFATKILYCDIDNAMYNILNLSGNNQTCINAKTKILNNNLDISLEDLKNNKYFEDAENRCSGYVIINAHEDTYKIDVDLTNVTCRN